MEKRSIYWPRVAGLLAVLLLSVTIWTLAIQRLAELLS